MSAPLNQPRMKVAEAARLIWRTQGVRGFYAGFVPILLRAFPVNAAAYSVYEGIMRLLGAEAVCALRYAPLQSMSKPKKFADAPIDENTDILTLDSYEIFTLDVLQSGKLRCRLPHRTSWDADLVSGRFR